MFSIECKIHSQVGKEFDLNLGMFWDVSLFYIIFTLDYVHMFTCIWAPCSWRPEKDAGSVGAGVKAGKNCRCFLAAESSLWPKCKFVLHNNEITYD